MRLPFTSRSGFPIKLLSLAICAASSVVTAPAQFAYAQQAVYNETISVDLKAGSLSAALNQLANTANIALSFDPSLTANKNVPAIRGRYTLEQLLQKLLAHEGLMAVEQDGGYVVVPVASAHEATTFDTIQVVSSSTKSYVGSSATSATGVETSILDTPRSIQVVSEKLIIDQQAQDLRDVLKNVSGVQSRASAGNTLDTFVLRGVDDTTIFQNGFQVNGNAIRIQTANVERVEVLKGPAALLFGQSSAGGVINVITKKPQQEDFNSVSGHFDEFGQRRLQLDSTGTLNESSSLLYRLVGSFEETDTFRKTDVHDRISRDLIAPSLTWNIDDKNTLNASFEWTDSSLPRARGTVLVEDATGALDLADVPRSRRFGEPDDSSDTIQQTATLDFQHIFDNDWVMDAGLVYQGNNSHTKNVNPAAGIGLISSPLLPDISNAIIAQSAGQVNSNAVLANGLLARQANQFSNDSDSFYGSLRFSGELQLAGFKHSLVSGLDYNRRETKSSSSQPFVTRDQALVGPLAGLAAGVPANALFSQLSILDIYNPVYGQSFNAFTPISRSDLVDTQVGLYLQDIITLDEQWKLALGLRVDRFERDSSNTSLLTPVSGILSQVGFVPNVEVENLSQDAIYEASPNAGLVFKPFEQATFYASYSESFQPNDQSVNQFTGQTENIDPSTSEQYELGFKGLFFDDSLNVNVAYFDITRQNVPAGSASSGVTLVNGEESSRGVELDANWQLVNGVNLLFSYAYIDTEVTGGDKNLGNRTLGVPRNSASLWASYEIQEGSWAGLGLAGGAVYQGGRYIDSANSFELDSYTTFDATAFYALPFSQDRYLRLQLGVKNLADKKYYVTANSGLDIGVGEPRTVFGSIGFEF